MLRTVCLAACLLQAGATISSLPSFKTAYDTAISGKTDWEVDQINQHVEGSAEPSDAGESQLWNWYRMTSGTAKADAKKYIDAAFARRGGSTDLLNDFRARVAAAYAGETTFADKWTNVYKKLAAAVEPDAHTSLWKQYNALTGTAQTEALKAVRDPIEAAFEAEWELTAFKNAWAADTITYVEATKAGAGFVQYTAADFAASKASGVVDATTPVTAGKKVFDAYKLISADAAFRDKFADFVAVKVAAKS